MNAAPPFPDGGRNRRTAVSTAAEMHQDLDDLGIYFDFIFRDHLRLLAANKQTHFALELARAFNRWMVD